MRRGSLYPFKLASSLHETIWGGQRLEQDRWKNVTSQGKTIGESWETEITTLVQNGPFSGQTLGALVQELGEALVGPQAIAIYGQRFPLLAKFIDANARLSVQVHPNDAYAAQHEAGKPGKTEFWYILAANPGSTIVHGFNAPTSRSQVYDAIQHSTLEELLHEEVVSPGDVIFVPAGTVHAIGSGVFLYELQEYSDITYRMYDYGRLTSTGVPRELHIERSLDVSHYTVSPRVKVTPIHLPASNGRGYTDRCLVACPYFITREITFLKQKGVTGYMKSETGTSCLILTSLGAEVRVQYGRALEARETLSRGETMVLPAALGSYRIEGTGTLLLSYVPRPNDEVWQLWNKTNDK